MLHAALLDLFLIDLRKERLVQITLLLRYNLGGGQEMTLFLAWWLPSLLVVLRGWRCVGFDYLLHYCGVDRVLLLFRAGFSNTTEKFLFSLAHVGLFTFSHELLCTWRKTSRIHHHSLRRSRYFLRGENLRRCRNFSWHGNLRRCGNFLRKEL